MTALIDSPRPTTPPNPHEPRTSPPKPRERWRYVGREVIRAPHRPTMRTTDRGRRMNVPEEAVEAAKVAYFDVANPGMRAAIEAALLFIPCCERCADCRGDE